MNRWSIPNSIEKAVFERDKSCVYCGILFGDEPQSFRERRSWEHIVNNAKLITLENIAC
jgi:5-methylcytosine-specific restriction endonuclease McrA